jgi:hypothetical protein
MMDVEHLEKLFVIFEGDADAAASCESIIQLAMMVNAAPLERAVQHLRQADTLGPIFEPTKYHEALSSGRLKHNQACFGALLDFVCRVQASTAAMAEHNAKHEAFRDPRKAIEAPRAEPASPQPTHSEKGAS